MKLSIILLLMFSITNYGQGCSDARICSVGNSFHDLDKEIKNSIEFGGIFGAGEADVTYFSPYLTYTRNFNKQFA